MQKLFLPLWALGSLLLFLYSFTQVDLSLTFSQDSYIRSILRSLQYIGWFERPLATYIYVGVFTFLFLLYLWTIRLISNNILSRKTIWITIITITIILGLSYNAFSYDLFNYIFDAKIVTFYNENPYIHKALDYPNDPMLSFMHWTHRTYPYGPGWLLLTVPISYLGGNIFILTFYLFKILIAAFFLLTVFSIEKLSKFTKIKNPLLPAVVFAFNPFVLSESLVSAHNDVVMMGIALFATYFLFEKKYIKGSLLYFISISIKFATALSLIVFFILMGLKKRNLVLLGSLAAMITAVILATNRTNFQPWYLLYVAPFAALLYEKSYIKFPFWIMSITAVVYYIPFLYYGNWDPPIPTILNNLVFWTSILSFATILILATLSNFKKPTEKK